MYILVVEVDTNDKIIKHEPWSGQKKLKFGFYYSIKPAECTGIMDEVTQALGKNLIIEIQDMLTYPSKESIESLIWVPERLQNKNLF